MKIIYRTFFLVPLFLCAQYLEDTPIVKVGSITISQKEFISRYELSPGLYRKKTQTESNKADFLVSLIAEKLLVLKAQQERWDTDTLLTETVHEVERLLVRDELYRRVVRQKVSLTESELITSMKDARNDIKVYFLYARTKEGADFLHAQIQKGKLLEEFSIDEHSNDELSGPDSAIARWGEMDERMEKVIYALKLNETSQPIYLDDAWYIVKVMGKTVTVIAGEKERAALKERVEATIRKRKEVNRMSEFMNTELHSKKAEINAKLLQSIVTTLWHDARLRNPNRSDAASYFVDENSLNFIRSRMTDTMRAILVKFPHRSWSVEQTLEKIRETNLVTARPSQRTLRIDVEQRLREVIDQEFLTEIGYQNGLHQSSPVRNDLKIWRDAYLAQIVRSKINDSIVVTQQDIDEIRNIFRTDTSIVNNNDKAKEKIYEIKSNQFIDRTLGGIANSTSITFYEKNFRGLQVSTTSSMVFRFLGFGGRMFAVPFVIPQTGWVNYWENKPTALP